MTTSNRIRTTISTHLRSSSSSTSTTTKTNAPNTTTTLLPSSSSSSSSWKQRFNLRLILLTSLLCMVAWQQSLLQNSSSSIYDLVLFSSSLSSPSSSSSVILSSSEIHLEEPAAQSQQQQQQQPVQLLLQQQPDTQSAAHEEETSANATTNETAAKTGGAQLGTLLEPPISLGTAQVRYPIIMDDTTITNIPKIIWMFWDTGWPAKNHSFANMNKRSWELMNPTFTVHALDVPTAERLTNRSAHVPDERWQRLHVQARSDIYRTLLLQKYGGIWADCNVFCNRPIQDWVDLNSTDIISFRRIDNLSEQVKKGIQPWITSWFLAAPPQSYTITKVTNIISDPNEHYRFRAQYFWWHHIVAQIANTDNHVNDVIQKYDPPWTCSGPHWASQAPVLKRCANKVMPPIIYTSEQCCPANGGRPHINMDNNIQNGDHANNMTEDIVKQQALLTELCSQWNCTVQAVNMIHAKTTRKLWGTERLGTLNTDYFDP